jgi:hypothetical protein
MSFPLVIYIEVGLLDLMCENKEKIMMKTTLKDLLKMEREAFLEAVLCTVPSAV